MQRPGLLRWIWYAHGGTLPPEYAPWVLHDTTASTWLLRHVARVLTILVVPVVVLVLVIPAGAGLRALTAITTAGCAVLLTLILASDMTERRAHRAGYPWGTAAARRSQRSEDAQRATAQRYRERRARRDGPPRVLTGVPG